MSAEEKGDSLWTLISDYWSAYGRLRELLRSPYLYMAVLIMPLTYGVWGSPNWWDLVLSILPNLLGISLAAFTLFLGAGSEGFRELIAGEDSTETGSKGAVLPSPFMKTATIFLHFLVVQFLAIVLALTAKSTYLLKPASWFVAYNDWACVLFWGLSFLLFLYSLSVVLAASFGVYEVVRWFDEFVKEKRKGNTGSQ